MNPAEECRPRFRAFFLHLCILVFQWDIRCYEYPVITNDFIAVSRRERHRVYIQIVQHVRYFKGAAELFEHDDRVTVVLVKGMPSSIFNHAVNVTVSVSVHDGSCFSPSRRSPDIGNVQIQSAFSFELFVQKRLSDFLDFIHVKDHVVVFL